MNSLTLLKAIMLRVKDGMLHIHEDEILNAHRHHVAMEMNGSNVVSQLQPGAEQPEFPEPSESHMLSSDP